MNIVKRSISLAAAVSIALGGMSFLVAPAQAADCLTGSSGATRWYLTNHCNYDIRIEKEQGLIYDSCHIVRANSTLALTYPNKGYRINGC